MGCYLIEPKGYKFNMQIKNREWQIKPTDRDNVTLTLSHALSKETFQIYFLPPFSNREFVQNLSYEIKSNSHVLSFNVIQTHFH